MKQFYIWRCRRVGKIFHHYIESLNFTKEYINSSEFKQVEGRYFYWFLSEHFRYEILRWNAKSTVDSVRLPLIQNFPIVIPPIEIQKISLNILIKRLNK